MKPYQVLVVAPSWVGDTLMAQPLFARIKERMPEAVIDVFAPPFTVPLYRHIPEVRDVIQNPLEHGSLNLRLRRRIGRDLAARRYDWAIVLPNTWKSALVPFFARIPLRTGWHGEQRYLLLNDRRKLRKSSFPLMVERYFALGGKPREALPEHAPHPHLVVQENGHRLARSELGIGQEARLAVLCPGAEYGPAKRWPVAHFAELARLLHDAHYLPVIVGSSKDWDVGEAITRSSAGLARNLCGRTDLSQAVRILAGAAVVISNDSGLMHMAAALDRPLVALFGSSSPKFTPPLSDLAYVLWLKVECSPCFKRECPLGHLKCLNDLSPDRVWEEVRRAVG